MRCGVYMRPRPEIRGFSILHLPFSFRSYRRRRSRTFWRHAATNIPGRTIFGFIPLECTPEREDGNFRRSSSVSSLLQVDRGSVHPSRSHLNALQRIYPGSQRRAILKSQVVVTHPQLCLWQWDPRNNRRPPFLTRLELDFNFYTEISV